MKVKVKKLIGRVKTPKYANAGDACFDLAVVMDDMLQPVKMDVGSERLKMPIVVDGAPRVMIEPHQTMVFHTGLAFEVPDGHVMLIYARSSTGFKRQLTLTNGTGVIDSGYRGEVKVALTNIGESTVQVFDGDRVAQACIVPLPEVELEEADELGESERGENGIGSSGR